MSIHESNNDNPNQNIVAIEVLQAIDDARIPDTIPDEIYSTYRHIIQSRGGIHGDYFVDTTRVEAPYLDVPLEREYMEQTFGIVTEEGDREAIKYVNIGGYPQIIVNEEVFDSIDTNDISIFDLTDLGDIADIIYKLREGSIQPEDIKDNAYQAPLMQTGIKWIIDKKALCGVQAIYRHHLIEKNGYLITVNSTSQPNGSKVRQIKVSNERGPLLHELSIVTDNETGETFTQKPVDARTAEQVGSIVKNLLGDSVLFH